MIAKVSLTVGVGQCTLDEPGELGAALGVVVGLTELSDRLNPFRLLSQGQAELVVSLRLVGFDPDHRAELGGRLLQLSVLYPSDAEMVVNPAHTTRLTIDRDAVRYRCNRVPVIRQKVPIIQGFSFNSSGVLSTAKAAVRYVNPRKSGPTARSSDANSPLGQNRCR